MYFKNYATRKVERISQDVELKEKHIDYKCNTLYRNPSIIQSILKTTRQVYNGPRVVKFITAKGKKLLVKNDF